MAAVGRAALIALLLGACAPPAPNGYSPPPSQPALGAGGGAGMGALPGPGAATGAGEGAAAPGTPTGTAAPTGSAFGEPGTGAVPTPSGAGSTPTSPESPAPAPGTGTPPTDAETPTQPGVFDAGSDPNRNNIQAGQLCARLTAIQCAGEAFCCQNPGRDRATCEATLMDACQNDAYFDVLSQNAITGFDAAAASAALTQAEQLASACDPSIVTFLLSAQGLAGVFKGTKPLGDDCSPGFSFDLEVAAASLASCASPGTNACLPKTTLNWGCAAPGGVGASCFTDINCQDGLYCPNPDLEIGMATCAARKALGAPCAAANECQSLFCGSGVCVTEDAQLAYCPAP